MKKIITFIPLGISISAIILYILNMLNFEYINNSAVLFQMITNLKIYLYIAIGFFILHLLIKYVLLREKNMPEKNEEEIEEEQSLIEEPKVIVKEILIVGNKACEKCGEKIFDKDIFCKKCGAKQNKVKTPKSIMNKIVNILEIVVLILILYFGLNMLFEYKESIDSNFKSPFKISLTK